MRRVQKVHAKVISISDGYIAGRFAKQATNIGKYIKCALGYITFKRRYAADKFLYPVLSFFKFFYHFEGGLQAGS